MASTPFIAVIVAYRSGPLVRRLIDRWGQDMPVVVVDNAGGADGLDQLPDECPWVSYVDGGGQGFARAANRGALAAAAPYLVFVNPDCDPTVADLHALVDGLAQDPVALSHAATMTDHDGDSEVGVGGWEPTVWRAAVFGFGLHKLLPTAGLFARPAPRQRLDVDWTTGACMAVRRSDFVAVGGFDEGFYVYCEDLSLGRRARNVGLRQVLRHDVTVRHGAGNSGAPSLEMMQLRGASIANYVQRYHPRSAHAIRAALIAGNTLRAGQRHLQRRDTEAAGFRSFVAGVATGRAYVGGLEVAAARIEETRPSVGAGR